MGEKKIVRRCISRVPLQRSFYSNNSEEQQRWRLVLQTESSQSVQHGGHNGGSSLALIVHLSVQSQYNPAVSFTWTLKVQPFWLGSCCTSEEL